MFLHSFRPLHTAAATTLQGCVGWRQFALLYVAEYFTKQVYLLHQRNGVKIGSRERTTSTCTQATQRTDQNADDASGGSRTDVRSRRGAARRGERARATWGGGRIPRCRGISDRNGGTGRSTGGSRLPCLRQLGGGAQPRRAHHPAGRVDRRSRVARAHHRGRGASGTRGWDWRRLWHPRPRVRRGIVAARASVPTPRVG